jgi:16S rRNA G966 N2-methylase RsmD
MEGVIDKKYIAKQIKNITLQDLEKDMNQLIKIGKDAHTVGPRSRIGNNVVDYFTFVQRLETKGKYDISFYEFLQNIEEFKKKQFIQTMLKYYKDVKNKNNTKNEYIVLKEVYNICISAINIMRPLNCMEIYTKYNAKRVLNFCAGWGGSTVAAAALNLDAFYGVEINTSLKESYCNMVSYLKTKCATFFSTRFCDALDVDYEGYIYDTVFSSPPYYFIEKYENNVKYGSKKDMDEKFYKPLFSKTYNGLQNGGHYIINICKEVYDNVLKGLLGEAREVFPLKKSKRQNNYTEMVYVWHKNPPFPKVEPNLT